MAMRSNPDPSRGLGWGVFLAGFVPGLLQFHLGQKPRAVLALASCLALFFADQLGRASSGASYPLGVAFIVIAAVVWAAYALVQKQLLVRLGSPAILWFIYVSAAILLLPVSSPTRLLALGRR